jgi:hydrogenase large subunit
MARGIENLLKGKDTRDAPYITERICGVCFTAHGWTSSMAVEHAHGTLQIPDAARLIRNLIAGAAWLHDHVLHFYHLSALDYLDVTALRNYTGSDVYLNKLKLLVDKEIANPPVDGQYAGPLVPTYAPDGYCISDTDTVAGLVQHYLSALQIQSKAKKLSAILGGKQPHQSGIVPGGVTSLPTIEQLDQFAALLDEVAEFINAIYIPDVVYLANGPLESLARSSVGVGYQNYLAYGGFNEAGSGLMFPEGAMVDGVLVTTSRMEMEAGISEDITRGWYTQNSGGHPSASEQVFNLDKSSAYSFVKAPRFNGHAMEVGPLARMMVMLNRADHPAYNHPSVQQFKNYIDQGFQPGAVTRHLARALETRVLIDSIYRWLTALSAIVSSGQQTQIHDTDHWEPPANGTGYGLSEAPRGALGHWINISDSRISNYACVVPTTWNASPRDDADQPGPFEKALENCPVPDEDNPINIGRIIRSFDPCIACAVHLITPGGNVKRYAVGEKLF